MNCLQQNWAVHPIGGEDGTVGEVVGFTVIMTV